MTTERDAAAATGATVASRARRVAFDRAVLLAGGLKPSPLMAASGMSTLDLPLDRGGRSLLERWRRQIHAMRGGDETRGDIILAESTSAPRSEVRLEIAESDSRFTTTEDPGLRGPAGALRDLSQDLEDDATILIIEAMRYFSGDLQSAIANASRMKSDITVFRHDDDRPAGLYLTTAQMLRLVAEEGFIDIKEQWLQLALASGAEVRVVEVVGGRSRPVRTLDDAVAVTRGDADCVSPVRRCTTQATHAGEAGVFIDPTAEVDSTAMVAESVVAAGAVIDANAIVVRSVIGAGAVVHRDAVVVDRVVKRGTRAQ